MPKRESTDYIAIHCSATPEHMDIGAAEIRKWHTDKGWRDIGYHFVIRRDGQVELGRDINEIGAHVRGFNDESIGICLVGGVDRAQSPVHNFTVSQMDTLGGLVSGLKQIYRNADVYGHRDFPGVNKACPCFDVPVWWKTYKERL